MTKKIVMLVQDGDSSRILYNALKNEFNIEKIIIEKKVSKKTILKRRIKRQGFFKVVGQILFMLFVRLFLKKISKKRILELFNQYQLDNSNFDKNISIEVNSINDINTLKILKKLNPDLIIVNGTRIISEQVLNGVESIFINTHMGITPKYRGVHGGYWALVNKDYKNCGVTVHLVDKGIDTGGVLYQDVISINNKDNFCTYPYHQIAKAIPLMKNAIKDVFSDKLHIINRDDLESKLWSHPTLLEYIKNFLFLKVK